MAVHSVTRIRIRSWRFVPVFLWHAGRVVRQAGESPGNLGVAVLKDKNRVYWTKTVWETQDDMRAFMVSGAHGKVMPRLGRWCDEAALVQFEADTDRWPTWDEAHERLQAEGRKTRLPTMTQDHIDMSFPAPRTG